MVLVSKVRYRVGKNKSKILQEPVYCITEGQIDPNNLDARSLADEIAMEGVFFLNIPSLIVHLRDEHKMSFEQLKLGINHIRAVVNDPAAILLWGGKKYTEGTKHG